MNARYVGQNQSNWLSVARFCSTWRADQIIIRLHSILLHWLQCPAKTFSFLITLLSSAPLIRSGSSYRKQGNPGIKEDYSQEFNKLIHLPVCCPCCVKWLLSIEDDGGESKSSHFQLSTGKRLKEIIQTFSKTSHIYIIFLKIPTIAYSIQRSCNQVITSAWFKKSAHVPSVFFFVSLCPSSLLTHWHLSTAFLQRSRSSHADFSEPFPNLYRLLLDRSRFPTLRPVRLTISRQTNVAHSINADQICW